MQLPFRAYSLVNVLYAPMPRKQQSCPSIAHQSVSVLRYLYRFGPGLQATDR